MSAIARAVQSADRVGQRGPQARIIAEIYPVEGEGMRVAQAYGLVDGRPLFAPLILVV